MHVVATAGHVDHGKSTLVRRLTGMEPDRWAEERRRGMTIDLGFAWASLDSGERLAFVDVPGHERFIGNMLAGLGPSPAVLVVVAADEGWRTQSEEHLGAVDALGLRHGLLVVTRSDLADPGPALAEARQRVARSSLGEVEALAVSAQTGAGIEELRSALRRLVARLPEPDQAARVRLWIDRSFTIAGAGTVVTGTLGEGTLCVGDELELRGRRVRVRGLQALGEDYDMVPARARVAVNLRSVAPQDVHRGGVLLTPQAWHLTDQVDVDVHGVDVTGLPLDVMVHVGSGAWSARVRPLGGSFARLRLPEALPLQAGDRLIVRDPGRRVVVAGATVLDADPPELARRGAAGRRAESLAIADARVDVAVEVDRRGAMLPRELAALGVGPSELRADLAGVLRVGEWLVSERAWRQWQADLLALVERRRQEHPMDPWVPMEQARRHLGAPDLAVLREVAAAADLDTSEGRVSRPGTTPSLGPAEAGLRALEQQLADSPFAAPERGQLDAWGLGARQLAAAEAAGRVVRLVDDIVLLPTGPARAMRELARLEQPFTTSAARQALGTTRRVVIPLLEHLDARGWTRRTDPTHRQVVR
ncbi:translation elongation factor [Arsenicicoccus sp. oral taxon 190]|nr:selenocysteine-specific translation elongation factor [Arsenicicoccus sp. oral taxon 190]AKT52917.1 translation elongation factor [Arsenicicoccus sp. oral taxon 190]